MRTLSIHGTIMASKKETKIKKITKKNTALPAKKGSKKEPVSPAIEEIDESEEEVDIIGSKSKVKKPAEIDAADILPEVDEKLIDEENPVLPLEDEEAEDAPGLDDEDLNPFGDKWEM